MPELDPETYGAYRQGVEHSITGAWLWWRDTPADEYERIVPIIERQAEVLRRDYRVRLEDDGTATLHLYVEHRRSPTPGEVADLKGRAFVLQAITSWGGPG